MQPKNKYLKCVWMNFLKVSILSFFFFLYTDIKYITSILLLLLLRKKYIILIADNSILTSYFIICELWRRHNLRQNHTTRRQTSHFVRVAEKTLPKRVPLHDRHVRNRVSLNCPRCFRRKHALKTRSNVRYNGGSFHWFWQLWVTPLLLGLPFVPAELLLRRKFPAMNPVPKTNGGKIYGRLDGKLFLFRVRQGSIVVVRTRAT